MNTSTGHTEQSLIADGHVHLYGCYDFETLFSHAAASLGVYQHTGDALGIFLTERSDCDFFRETCCRHPAFVPLEHRGDEIIAGRIDALYVFAGRQIATAERLEVLALCSNEACPDGLPFDEALARVQASGAIAVLPWSPGKWLGARGNIIERAVEAAEPGDLLLADSSMRPWGCPEPRVFRTARARGLGIIAGTDPLPFAGQERVAGTFGFRVRRFDGSKPVQSIRELLLRAHPAIEIVGRRSSPLALLQRLTKMAMAKR